MYALFGVENFNAEVRNGQLIASIRTGQYPVKDWATKEVLRSLRSYIHSEKVVSERNNWIFRRSDRVVQLAFEEEIHEELEKRAGAEGLSFKE